MGPERLRKGYKEKVMSAMDRIRTWDVREKRKSRTKDEGQGRIHLRAKKIWKAEAGD